MTEEDREEYDTYEILKVDERKELRSELEDPAPSDFGPRLVLEPLAAFRLLVSPPFAEPFAGQS